MLARLILLTCLIATTGACGGAGAELGGAGGKGAGKDEQPAKTDEAGDPAETKESAVPRAEDKARVEEPKLESDVFEELANGSAEPKGSAVSPMADVKVDVTVADFLKTARADERVGKEVERLFGADPVRSLAKMQSFFNAVNQRVDQGEPTIKAIVAVGKAVTAGDSELISRMASDENRLTALGGAGLALTTTSAECEKLAADANRLGAFAAAYHAHGLQAQAAQFSTAWIAVQTKHKLQCEGGGAAAAERSPECAQAFSGFTDWAAIEIANHAPCAGGDQNACAVLRDAAAKRTHFAAAAQAACNVNTGAGAGSSGGGGGGPNMAQCNEWGSHCHFFSVQHAALAIQCNGGRNVPACQGAHNASVNFHIWKALRDQHGCP